MSPARDLILIGGGEHARVVCEAARSGPDEWNVLGFVDPRPCEETAKRFGIKRLGDDSVCRKFAENPNAWFVMSVGGLEDADLRSKVAAKFDREKFRWATVIHSRAFVSPSAKVGEGTVIFAGAIVQSAAVVARHCILNTGSVIEHDVQIGEFSHVGPGAVIGGGAAVGKECLLGLGCRIRDHVRIGNRVTVGMGSVVVDSVGEGQIVLGVPAKPRVKV